MIDTTTVNYALDKMAEAYRAVAPTVGQISEKYVTYIMWQQIVPFIVACVVLILGLVSLGIGFKLISKTPTRKNIWGEEVLNDGHPKFIFGLVFSVTAAFLVIGGALGFFSWGQDVLLCYKNPEMFAVEHLIQSIKK